MMKSICKYILIALFIFSAILLCGFICSSEVNERFQIKEGYVTTTKKTIKYRKGGKTVARVTIGKPIIVAMADQPEEWGYFQFPVIDKANDGTILVGWQMNEDSHLAYGKKSKRGGSSRMSKDDGKTWQEPDRGYFVRFTYYKEHLKDGSIFEITTPTSKDIRDYKQFPKPVGYLVNNYKFYRMNDMPNDFKGNYLILWDKNGKAQYVRGEIRDDELLRPSISYSLPVVWWGIPRQLSDGSIMVGASQMYYKNHERVQPSSVTFYRSVDTGRTWDVVGKIPYEPVANLHPEGSKREFDGFTEPYWVILKDSTFLCVLRSEDKICAPLYKSTSKDFGRTWSKPEPFTPNGVLPQMLQLGNGVLVLSSGRPGVQLRFCFDGKGNNWSEPIDMMSFMKSDGTYDWYASCGYTSMLPLDDESFLIAYSDFHEHDAKGEERKAIKVRKVTVKYK